MVPTPANDSASNFSRRRSRGARRLVPARRLSRGRCQYILTDCVRRTARYAQHTPLRHPCSNLPLPHHRHHAHFCSIFVVAILLSGVLEDYKEAEGFPDALAAEFEAAADRVSFAAGLPDGGEKVDARANRGSVLAALGSVFCFLCGEMNDSDVIATVSSRFRAIALELAKSGAGECAEAVLAHSCEIRKIVGRLYVIKRTDFLQSGAALMELLVNITVFLAILQRDAEDEHWLTAHCNVAFIAFQFFYIIELLKDIDDPFEYSRETLLPIVEVGEDGERRVGMRGAGSSAEVDTFPLMHAYGRILQGASAVQLNGKGAAFAQRLHDRMVEVWGVDEADEASELTALLPLSADSLRDAGAPTADPVSAASARSESPIESTPLFAESSPGASPESAAAWPESLPESTPLLAESSPRASLVSAAVRPESPPESTPLVAEPSLEESQPRSSFSPQAPSGSSSSPHASHSHTPRVKLHSHDNLRMAAAAAAASNSSGAVVATRPSATADARAAAFNVIAGSATVDYVKQPQLSRATLFSSHADGALQELRHRARS